MGTVQRTAADAVIETVAVYSIVWHLSRPRCAALYFVRKALRRRCRAHPGAQQACGRERGDDEGQEDTLARKVHKKLLVECISAYGGHLPEDGLGKKVVVAKEAVSYDVQRRCIKGEGLHKRTLMHN